MSWIGLRPINQFTKSLHLSRWWSRRVTVLHCNSVSHGYANVTRRGLINMPREIITIQLGQCGNQGKTMSRKVYYVYISNTAWSKWASHSGNDYAQNMAASIRTEFLGGQTEVIEGT